MQTFGSVLMRVTKAIYIFHNVLWIIKSYPRFSSSVNDVFQILGFGLSRDTTKLLLRGKIAWVATLNIFSMHSECNSSVIKIRLDRTS